MKTEEGISIEAIIEIHEYAIRRWGGLPGMRDEATLHHLVYIVNKEPDPIRQATHILHTIATGHPFFDGNKRTAFLTADMQLGKKGLYIQVEHDEGLSFMLALASGEKTRREVSIWLKGRISGLY